ncbi:LacI family DNA-binding transcriptional regulator [Streptomyces acidicola]|uniref:LacI family DNA-binding transcriptional regulator n=1 Tax=Streptomyces acidicola TaxID=2596892 RepID=UPI003791D2C8
MQQRSRPTVREVATLAGVSVATVSYVVNGRDGLVGAETRERVPAAVRELGYVPSSSARGLRTQRTWGHLPGPSGTGGGSAWSSAPSACRRTTRWPGNCTPPPTGPDTA